ncbi:putative leucine-rich repeat-containing protein DDB-G0290503 [Arapaima gigas]
MGPGTAPALLFFFILHSSLLHNALCRNVLPLETPFSQGKTREKRGETIIQREHINLTVTVIEEDLGKDIKFEENCQEVRKELDKKINELDDKTNVNSRLALKVAELQFLLQKAQTENQKHINVVKKQLQDTISELQKKNAHNAELVLKVNELQRALSEIQKWATDRVNAQVVVLQTELQKKVSELDEKSNDNSKLYLQILALQKKMKELESGSSAQITDLQKQLQATAEQLKIKKQQLEVKSGLNYQLVLQILELQNNIWALQKGQTGSSPQVAELLKQLEMKINQLQETPDDDSKLVLKIFALESTIQDLQREYVNQTIPALIDEVQKKLDGKNKELENTLKQLENRKNENSKLLLQIVNLTQTVENLQKQDKTKTLTDQVKDLQNKLQNMDKGLFDLRASYNVIDEKLRKTTSQLEGKISENTRLVAEINRLNKLIEDMKKEVAERNAAQITELQNQLHTLITDLNEKTNDNSKKVLEILSLKNEINFLKSGSSAKIKELEQLLKEKAEQLKLKNKQLEMKTNLNSELVLQILELQSIIWDLERGGTDGKAKLQALLKQLESKIAEMEEEDGDDSKLVLKIFALESVIREISRQSINETSPGVLHEIQQQLDAKNKELEETVKQLESRKNENSKMLGKIVEMQEKLKKVQKNVTDQTVVSHFAEMQNELNQMKVKYQKLLANCNELQKHLEESMKEMENVTNYNSELELQVKSLKNLLLEVETKVSNEATAKIAVLKTEVDQKINELKQVSNDNSKLILQIRTLQAQINNIKSGSSAELQALQNLLKQKQEELKLKNKQLEVKTDLNSQLVIQILELQAIIEEKESTDTSGTADLSELLKELERKINQMEDKSDDDSKLVLKIFALETMIRDITKQVSNQTSPKIITELEAKLEAKNKELQQTLEKLKARKNENSKMLVEIVELEKTVDTLQKQAVNQNTIAQIAEMQTQMAKKDEEYKQLKRNCNAAQRELQETRDELDRKISANSRLMEQINELKKLLESTNQAQTSTEIAVLKNELEKKIDELKVQADDNSKLVLQIYTLQSQVKTLQTGSSTRIKELQQLLKQKSEQLKEKNKQLEMKTDLNSKLVLQILELQGIIYDLEKGGTNGTNRLFEVLGQLEEKIDQMEEKPEDDTKLVLKIFALQNIIKELVKQSANTTDRESDKTANLELQKKLDAKNKELVETIDKLKQKDNENSKMLVQIIELETSVRQLQESLNNQTTVTEIAELKEQLKDMDDRYAELQSKYSGLEKQLKEKQRAYTQLQTKYNDLLKELEGSASADSKLQRQLKDKEEENNRLQAKLKDLQKQITEKADDCSKLQSRYDDLQNKLVTQNENQSKLQAAYNDLQKQMKDKENEYTRLNNKYNDMQKQVKEMDEKYKILQDKYTDVQNEIEEKNDSKIKTSNVFLDADTAHPRLLISEDGSKMKIATKRQNVPDSPNRFDTHFGVLGKVGFTSGKRYWEVYVKGRPCYSLGVTEESATRKGNFRLQPRNKYWGIIKVRGNVIRALDNRVKTLRPTTDPQIVGVFLDYEGGKVSFYDANTKTLLYAFKDITFEEKVFPYILTCEDTDPDDGSIIMSPVSKSVSWLE